MHLMDHPSSMDPSKQFVIIITFQLGFATGSKNKSIPELWRLSGKLGNILKTTKNSTPPKKKVNTCPPQHRRQEPKTEV